MVKIKIGLYKNKETGKFDVMINQMDNIRYLHNGEFKLIKEFEFIEKSKKEMLIDELISLNSDIRKDLQENICPLFLTKSNINDISDKKIKDLRDNLYDFMVMRSQLLENDKF